jgi:hypothetical protein
MPGNRFAVRDMRIVDVDTTTSRFNVFNMLISIIVAAIKFKSSKFHQVPLK